MHFFSPANVMRLLEVVRGEKTFKQVVATAMPVLLKIKHDGGLSARLAFSPATNARRPPRRKHRRCFMEGAMPWDVDKPLYDFGMPMGPFDSTAGLDTTLKETGRAHCAKCCAADRRARRRRGLL